MLPYLAVHPSTKLARALVEFLSADGPLPLVGEPRIPVHVHAHAALPLRGCGVDAMDFFQSLHEGVVLEDFARCSFVGPQVVWFYFFFGLFAHRKKWLTSR